jgi:multimeric flavodoxin WrbA
MKIIAINGSPKKDGNTATLMRWIIKGCEKEGAEVEWIDIINQNILYCRGCHGCLRTGKCVIEDDLHEIFKKLNEADGIIIGSPVYSGQATAPLRAFIDRLTLLKLYSDILNSAKTIGVTTSGIAPTHKLAKELANFFGRRIAIIGIKCASLKKGYQKLAESYDKNDYIKAFNLGKKLILSIKQEKKPRVLFNAWINFLRKYLLSRVIKNNSEQFIGVLPVWYERGWLKRKS